jgi:hypothetical protein
MINGSYVLPASVLFFVAVFELIPSLRIGAVPARISFLSLGASVLWIAQLHMAFVLLLPVGAVAVVLAARERPRVLLEGLPWLLLGAAITGATLVPTLVRDGAGVIAGLTRSNMHAEPRTVLVLPALVARFFSFGSFELARFIGGGSGPRFEFLAAYPVAAPFAIIAGLMGVLQTAWLALGMFRRTSTAPQWPAVRLTIWALLVLVGAAFTVSVKGPASHAFYVMMPAVMIYSFYCWLPVLRHPLGRRAAMLLLVSGAVTLTALGIRNFHLRSLYTNRPLIMKAITEKNYHVVGERRPDIWRAEGR